ncbi:glycosyltransferase [Trypanosoma rangeli]|uniref:Glycosyltransferase n=1 Tax=Trypanosoma rangeli TaxID=5698 RepID=A0A422P1D3_TRYRA|nr:glycosyltransferase [Trypanosoma rangeli]RNF11485.1 glycosyltransferase [Trypanosoma rangeli]|eukprot:RNF11485.1 glycosyltransferase [Trypanosoma rangeli]
MRVTFMQNRNRRTKIPGCRIRFFASGAALVTVFVFFTLALGYATEFSETADPGNTVPGRQPQTHVAELAVSAWNVSLEMESARMKIRASIELFAERLHELREQSPNITNLNKSCHFAYPLNRRITRFEYKSKNARVKHSLTPVAFFNALQQEAESRVFVFFDSLPWIVRQTPVVLSPQFDIKKRFGLWRVFFCSPLPNKRDSRALPSRSDGEWALPLDEEYSESQFLRPQPPLYMAVFFNAVVSNSFVITCGGNVYTCGGCLRRWHLPIIQSTEQLDWRGVVVALCDEWCKGYYHFTHEHLPRLALVHKILLEREDAVLVLYAPMKSFHRQWLIDVLGIPSGRIMRKTLPVHGNLVLYPIPNVCGTPFTHLTYALRDIVFERLHLMPPLPVTQRKLRLLFAERARLSRMPFNYHKLKQQILEEYDALFEFRALSGNLHVAEQIHAFYDADIVVGPHGSNLANAMWMRHGSHLMEFISYRYANMCYHTTASSINVTYHAIFHNAWKDGKYFLSYETIRRHINYAVEALLKSQ